MSTDKKDLMEVCKQMLTQMEQKLHESWPSEEIACFTIPEFEGIEVVEENEERGIILRFGCNFKF